MHGVRPQLSKNEPKLEDMISQLVLAKNLRSFVDRDAACNESSDYLISHALRSSYAVGISAPYGGRIEAYKSEIATAIVGANFCFYRRESWCSTSDADRCSQAISLTF
jgi:phage replication-related protein YjqB (UPF0714/DUF867 family)